MTHLIHWRPRPDGRVMRLVRRNDLVLLYIAGVVTLILIFQVTGAKL